MPSRHLLDLPPELLEHILALLAHENAPSLPACRQTCRALNSAITHSPLLHYLEHAALLGVYDPLVPDAPAGGTAAPPLTVRTAALHAWDDAWQAIDALVCSRRPDARFALPEHRTRGAVAGQQWLGSHEVEVGQQEQELQEHRHFSFGPWFVVEAREGPGVRAGYSYLDVHGCLGRHAGVIVGREGGGNEGDGDEGGGGWEGWEDRAPPRWTTIDVPVRDVVVFALSTEMDLAMAVSCVLFFSFLILVCLILVSGCAYFAGFVGTNHHHHRHHRSQHRQRQRQQIAAPKSNTRPRL
jgi:hypothetical protein